MKLNETPAPKHAFSLVELSIVLVVLGLLVGGVLSGRSLIRAAELRSISTQYNQFYTATKAFRDKYFALPGDMPNATKFWGAAGPPLACEPSVGVGTQTCDGDGNGSIDIPGFPYEPLRYWQHLSNAGLIEGSYVGSDLDLVLTSTEAPVGKMKGSVWFVYNAGLMSGQPTAFDGEFGNSMSFAHVSGYLAAPTQSLLSPEEAWNVDTKMDDGKPALGKLVMTGVLNLCTTAAVSSQLTADYLLTNSNKVCDLHFRQQF